MIENRTVRQRLAARRSMVAYDLILSIAAGLGLIHGGNDARKERHSRDASCWFGYVWHGACGAAPASLCRDHGRLRAGRICAGGCQSRRWPFCRLCGSDLRGTPQRLRASKPLPQVDPRLVADCKVQNRTSANVLRHHRKRPNPRRLEKARRRASAPRRHLKQPSRQFKRTRPRLRRHHKCRRRRKSMTARNELTWIDFICGPEPISLC